MKFRTPPNYEVKSSYSVSIGASDESGNSSELLNVTITITNVNEAPGWSGSNPWIVWHDEGGVTAAQYRVIDLEGDPVDSWSLSGDDSARFSMRSVSDHVGALEFKSAPDYEAPVDVGKNNVYDVTITAHVNGHSIRGNVYVHIRNIADGTLTISGTSSPMYAENGTTTVASYTTDAAAGATVTWSLPSGADKDKFSISSEGALSFNSPPDFEVPSDADTNNTYLVTVRATDGEGTDTLDVTVTVTNANDPPHFHMIEGFRATSKDLGEGYGGYLLSFRAVDRDGDAISPSVSGPDADRFTFTWAGFQKHLRLAHEERPAAGLRESG